MREPRYAKYDGKFDAVGDQEWVRDVLKLTTNQPWRYSGECPRCGHPIDLAVEVPTPGPVIGLARIDLEPRLDVEPPLKIVYRELACNCVEPHDGRETTESGCGIYGQARLRVRVD